MCGTGSAVGHPWHPGGVGVWGTSGTLVVGAGGAPPGTLVVGACGAPPGTLVVGAGGAPPGTLVVGACGAPLAPWWWGRVGYS